jgi:putative membrane protein
MFRVAPAVAVVLGFAVCGSTAWPQTEPSSGSGTAETRRPLSNEQFVNEIGHANAAEVRLGRVCQRRHDSEKVGDFGRAMREDHTRAQDQLRELAKKKGWTIPEDPNAEQKAAVDRLDKLSGRAFDQAYMDLNVKDHERVIGIVESYGKDGADADLKAYANRVLPVLKHHLEMAKDLAKTVGS